VSVACVCVCNVFFILYILYGAVSVSIIVDVMRMYVVDVDGSKPSRFCSRMRE
jgi:hypothetical protein